ncbi:MAG: hypothetical protein QM426_05905 [Euryarchaeota archaeon]|nr:hypothetical protein [Euryarchaeota archaeon]
MGIHRDFSALFLHTKEELIFIYPEILEKVEKMLFKGDLGRDFIKYTCKMSKYLRFFFASSRIPIKYASTKLSIILYNNVDF